MRRSIGWKQANWLGLGGAALMALGMILGAASPGESGQQDPCERSRDWNADREQYCEVREFQGSVADGALRVDGGANGGISVVGSAGGEIHVTAVVNAWAEELDRAREIGDAVEVRLRGSDLDAEGPDTRRREGWSVSYQVRVPRSLDLDLSANNGGIGVEGVHGRVRFHTTNGGVAVRDAGGDVQGRTTNGGVSVVLSGSSWEGEGLDVRTTNGGVRLVIPEGFSGELETGTVNGGIEFDFPVTLQGRVGREVRTTLGSGGPPIRVRTTNGAVRLVRP